MPINKFTTLLDLSRQAKILTGETATFDGKISLGIPFSGYPTGVDTATTVSLGVISTQTSVFSGGTGTTVFDVSNIYSPYYNPSFDAFSATTWSNPVFSANTSGLTLPITILSADTQIVGPFWTLTQTGYTGEYIIGTQYTGYSVTYSFNSVTTISSPNTFSGFTTASQEIFSAGTLDYKGPLDYLYSAEDATIKCRLTTDKLTIQNGASSATTNYLLTQVDDTGKAEWASPSTVLSGLTIWTAGTGTNSAVLGGTGGIASGSTSVSEGNNTIAGGTSSHAEGVDTMAMGDYGSHAEGYQTISGGWSSHAEGNQTTSSGNYSHAEGSDTTASGDRSHAEGSYTIASGATSHSEGDSTIAGGASSHAEGDSSIASGTASHAEGFNSIASNFGSHAEGSNTTAAGQSSHAEGESTIASTRGSHAEGYKSLASGYGSHAEGGIAVTGISGGTASGPSSHAEGLGTLASGTASHAEGSGTTASGNYSHSEGLNTTASGTSSHAGGNQTTVNGINGFGHSAFSSIDVDSDYSSILGGSSHLINKSTHSSILGGYLNYITGNTSNNSIIGGYGNTLYDSDYSSILGGENNKILFNTGYGWGSIIGGKNNSVSGQSNYYTIIGGGNSIIADSNGAIIMSESSEITGNMDYSAILAGTNNIMTTTFYTGPANTIMAGGNNNLYRNSGLLGSNNSVMLGGQEMTINGITNMNSMITSYQSAMSGTVSLNTIMTSDNCNINTGTESFIIGSEQSNLRNVYQSMLLGTFQSNITGSSTVTSAFILGGEKHSITGPTNTADYSAIINGSTNTINSTRNAIIIGGSNVSISGNSDQSVAILSKDSYIDGTSVNSGLYSTELSLITNSSNLSTITGGYGHTITDSDYSIIIGGSDNTISNAQRTVILGGSNITATTNDTVYMNNLYVTQTGEGVLETDLDGGAGSLVSLSGSSKLPRFSMSVGTGGVGTGAGGSIGVRAWDDVTYAGYGQPGDMHIYAGISSNGLNIISADGSGGAEDYIRFYAGRTANMGGDADIHIQGTGATQGFVGLGTENPLAKLDVNGSVIISGSTNVTGNGRFQTIGASASAGALHYTADGTLTTNTSDERLKTNITTLTNALDKVKLLRGVSYNWMENPTGDTRIGFIAQEVGSIIPELSFINKNSPEQYMGVHYDNVTALLVEAIKELTNDTINNTFLETQTILAEDNNVELNFNGTQQTAIGGGLSILHAKGKDQSADLITDNNGDFVTNNDFKPNALTIPFYTPNSSNDDAGSEGNIARDDNYMYIKTSTGWKRTNLESF